MQFSVIALLAVATGALAAPGGPSKPNKPNKPHKPSPPNVNVQSCYNDQALYCCNSDGHGAEVKCESFSNGGVGGICNGIQMCCNNNEGAQGCSFAVGGGIIVVGDGKGW
ncbi:hypothetical protein FVEN_g9622 [Fusarium venenatum]|uniref:Hydrophobin n=1 Tax=Fusarium venenatum TaxID=56646 RepID=A0A2L2TA55_9HYPO|nr:uncharacterized protein FVRRES_04334 [Fusarium venenatum]KAG8352492.1 hypothetical protein FVEN_g9622 [Fusarium venenatum]KAH7002722.1 hypothetical protein EDB82DRAFT_481896 [Fusarium venenatum]CEI67822.1 unnamed protein product [Fusarium venenatum]